MLKNLLKSSSKCYSVELCSSKNLHIDDLSKINPILYSITWHTTLYANPNNIPAILLAVSLIKLGKNVLLHLPCRYFSKEEMFEILTTAKGLGIVNIFAILGDQIEDEQNANCVYFKHANDLVKYIKTEFRNTFFVGVAGYPLCHQDSISEEIDILHLKQKIDAGADFIITQAIFELETFHKFYKNCRNNGIMVPIIPGIFIITSSDGLKKMSTICKVSIPESILNIVESVKDDDDLKKYGMRHASELINNLLKDQNFPVNDVHIFSFNNIENICEISHVFYN